LSLSVPANFKALRDEFLIKTGAVEETAGAWLHKYAYNVQLASQHYTARDKVEMQKGMNAIDATAATLGLKSIVVDGPRGHGFYLAVSQQLALLHRSFTYQRLRHIAAIEIRQVWEYGQESPLHPQYLRHADPGVSFQQWCWAKAQQIVNVRENPHWADEIDIVCLLEGLRKNNVRLLLRIISSTTGKVSGNQYTDHRPAPSYKKLPELLVTIGYVYGRDYLGTIPVDVAAQTAVPAHVVDKASPVAGSAAPHDMAHDVELLLALATSTGR